LSLWPGRVTMGRRSKVEEARSAGPGMTKFE
jgi:hypothetical protein